MTDLTTHSQLSADGQEAAQKKPLHIRVAEALTRQVRGGPGARSRADLFWSHVGFAPGNCWLWGGTIDQYGYGSFKIGGKSHQAHQIAYMLSRGEIPVGLEMDHLCRTRACVNPLHLEPVTRQENVNRGLRCAKDQCRYGHSMANAYICRDGHRCCHECTASRDRKRKLKEAGKL